MINLPELKKFNIDLKAEPLAILLIDTYNLEINQILLDTFMWHQRPARKDVIAWNTESFSHRLEKQLISLESSRESLFDTLPESIFFNPGSRIETEDSHVVTVSEEEENGRKFLLPYQQLFFWLKVLIEQNSIKSEEEVHLKCQHLFGDNQFKHLPEIQKNTLLGISPFLEEIIGDWELTGQFLSYFLDLEVEIKVGTAPNYILPVEAIKTLGNCTLGSNFVIGNLFIDGVNEIIILFKHLKPSEIHDLLPNEVIRKLLEDSLLPYILPIETPYSITLEPEFSNNGFCLSSENNLLGYTLSL